MNESSHATEQINIATKCGREAAREAKFDPPSTSLPQINKTPSLIGMNSEEHWQRNAQDKSFPTTVQVASAETIQGEHVAHQRPLSSLVPPRPHTLYAGVHAPPKTPSPGVERMLDSHLDRPYGWEGHYRDSQGGCVDGVLGRQSLKPPQASVITAQTTNSSPALPTPIEHSKRALIGEEVISPAKVAQLSSELRTRLSYAMVKVKNGWQSKTIDEVESLASRKGSPASSTSSKTGISVPIYHN